MLIPLTRQKEVEKRKGQALTVFSLFSNTAGLKLQQNAVSDWCFPVTSFGQKFWENYWTAQPLFTERTKVLEQEIQEFKITAQLAWHPVDNTDVHSSQTEEWKGKFTFQFAGHTVSLAFYMGLFKWGTGLDHGTFHEQVTWQNPVWQINWSNHKLIQFKIKQKTNRMKETCNKSSTVQESD